MWHDSDESPIDVADLLKRLENHDEIEKVIRQSAGYLRIAYVALIQEGFMPEQAIELIKGGYDIGGVF